MADQKEQGDGFLDNVNVEELREIVKETEKPAAAREAEMAARERLGGPKREQEKIDHEAQVALIADERNMWDY